MRTFTMLQASSKLAICGLALRVDSYRSCSFGCVYCFANGRKIMTQQAFQNVLQIGDLNGLRRRVERVESDGPREGNLVDALIARGIDWHCGGMSDPFQPCESEYHITRGLCDLTREHGIHVLFSTKTDDLRGCFEHLDPELHAFQLSVSNVDNRTDIEANVPPIASRKALFDALKDSGFRVGIRIQPYIPGMSDERIVDMFQDADHFTIEGLKLVPQNKEQVKNVLELTGLEQGDFINLGLLNLRPEIRHQLYKHIIAELEYHAIPYSIADNDMHDVSKCRCCCGDALVHKSTGFDSTAMCFEHGPRWSLNDVLDAMGGDIAGCRMSQLVTSNRKGSCVTVEDFFRAHFYQKTSPYSPQFLYLGGNPYGMGTLFDPNE